MSQTHRHTRAHAHTRAHTHTRTGVRAYSSSFDSPTLNAHTCTSAEKCHLPALHCCLQEAERRLHALPRTPHSSFGAQTTTSFASAQTGGSGRRRSGGNSYLSPDLAPVEYETGVFGFDMDDPLLDEGGGRKGRRRCVIL